MAGCRSSDFSATASAIICSLSRGRGAFMGIHTYFDIMYHYYRSTNALCLSDRHTAATASSIVVLIRIHSLRGSHSVPTHTNNVNTRAHRNTAVS